MAAAQGRLAELGALEWDRRSAVTVVVASENYPGTPRTGDPIGGLPEPRDDAYVLHAGTALRTGSSSAPAAACCRSSRSGTT